MRDIRPVYDRRLGDESLWRLEELDVFLRVAVDEVYWPNRIEPLEFGEHQEAPFLSLRWWSHVAGRRYALVKWTSQQILR